MTNYHDNISGLGQRIKIRIRWYGNTFGMIKKPILEIKIKNNELGSKLSYPLKPFILNKNTTSKEIQHEIFKKSNLPEWLLNHLKCINPTLLNKYERKYFRSANKKYRITLDYNMNYYELHQINNSFTIPEHDPNIILELKYGVKSEHSAHKITNKFPFRLTKSSKYITGINKTNNITHELD